MYITISIDEGPQYRLGKVDVKGDLLDAAGVLPRSACRSRPARSSTARSCRDDLQKLTDFYKDRGYAYVNVTPATPVDEKTRIVDVIFEIQKGELVYFDRINIRGNTKTRDKVIRREMRISRASSYNQTQLDYSKRRVNALGFFEKVDVSTKRGSSRRQDGRQRRGRRAADRHVPDRRRLLVGRELHRPGADLAEQPVRPRQLAHAAGAALQPAPALPAAVPGPLLPRHQLDLRLQPLQPGPVPATRSSRTSKGGSLTWGYLLAEDAAPAADLQAARTSASSTGGFAAACSPAASAARCPLGSLANLLRSGITSSGRALAVVRHARRPHVPAPAAGTTRSPPRSPSLPCFRRTSVHPLRGRRRATSTRSGGRSSCALKAEAGLITSRDPRGVPIFERYFVGGIYDIRGFAPLLAGPGHPRRPRSQAPDAVAATPSWSAATCRCIGNAEIEFPIFDKVGIRGVVFFDVGNAFNLEDQYCKLKPFDVDVSKDPCVKCPLDSTPTAPAGASASAGSRPSARCASSGASRSGPCRARQHRLRVHHRQRALSRPSGHGGDDGRRSGPLAASGLRFRSSSTSVHSGPVLGPPCQRPGLSAGC